MGMGTYLNPGKQAFQIAVNSNIFVDKTEMILYLNSLINTKQRFVSVTRPRRFGKTMAAGMICAYYDREADSRELFEKRRLAKHLPSQVDNKETGWDDYLGHFDVIRIVMTRFFKRGIAVHSALSKLQKLVIRDYKKAYPDVEYGNDEDLIRTIEDVYTTVKRQVVIVIDEWDVVFRVLKNDKEGQMDYLDFLRDLMHDTEHIALAYMTGILPIRRFGQHSALGMFTKHSMMFPGQLASCTGFTDEEVRELCNRFGRDYDRIRDWYNGYEVNDAILPDPIHQKLRQTGNIPKSNHYSLYNPLSVVEVMTTGMIRNYWNQTETCEALAEHIRKDIDGLKDAVVLLMSGERLRIDTSTCQNDMTTFSNRDDVLSLLVHLGYLGFDAETSEVFIPNKEVLEEFKTATKTEKW